MTLSDVKILICDKISEKGIKKITDSGFNVVYDPNISPEQLISSIVYFDGVIVRSRTQITKEVIFAGKKLKVIGRAGVGLDNVDLRAAEEANIQVYNTPDALTNAVAELVIGLMLNLVRGICLGDSSIRKGKWIKNKLIGQELKGKTLGIIGLGRIGKRIAELAYAFNMKILYYDIIDIPKDLVYKLNLKYKTIDELIEEADIITLNIPINEDTRHFINKERLGRMKKTSYLINASRGSIINENALIECLKKENIAGAALDVFEEEPITRNDINSLSNIICTPHIGAQTIESQELAALTIAELIIKYFKNMDKI